MTTDKPTVFVVDDDDSLRNALRRLLQLHGYTVKDFTCAEEFLSAPLEAQNCCLLLDLQLPGLGGIELQNFLLRRDYCVPVVFISGHGNIPTAIRAIKAGAVGFLTKPFNEDELLEEIDRAVEMCRELTSKRDEMAEIVRRFESLTAREKQIFEFVVSGKLNKQTASDLGIVIHTVKVHRRRIMRKMRVDSLAELVVVAQKLRALKCEAGSPSEAASILSCNGELINASLTAISQHGQVHSHRGVMPSCRQ